MEKGFEKKTREEKKRIGLALARIYEERVLDRSEVMSTQKEKEDEWKEAVE